MNKWVGFGVRGALAGGQVVMLGTTQDPGTTGCIGPANLWPVRSRCRLSADGLISDSRIRPSLASNHAGSLMLGMNPGARWQCKTL